MSSERVRESEGCRVSKRQWRLHSERIRESEDRKVRNERVKEGEDCRVRSERVSKSEGRSVVKKCGPRHEE